MEFEDIITNRLKLRKFDPEVFTYIYEELSEEDQMKHLGFIKKEELINDRKKYDGGLWTHNKKFLYFQLLDLKTEQIIGWCGYHTWYTDHDRAEIGYGLYADEYKRQGLMTEALKPILDYGFNQMNLHRIEAFAAPANTGSIRLLTNFGFLKEGLLREHYRNEVHPEDSAVYGLLKREYKYP